MSEEPSIVERLAGHVGVVSFNRPHKHNAMHDVAQAELLNAMQRMAGNPQVRCVLLRGEGKSFCAGRDTSVLGQRPEGVSDYLYVRQAQRISHAFMDCPKPIVAAVKGAAIGGGFEFALMSDMRVVGRNAKMSLPEIRYGLLPDMGGTQTLTSMIGRAKAKYHVMTGKPIGGGEALALGIADWLVEDDEVDAKSMEIAEEIALSPPQNLMMAKRLVDQFWLDGIRKGMEQELLSISALFKSADYAEARAALKEKRPPRFQGK